MKTRRTRRNYKNRRSHKQKGRGRTEFQLLTKLKPELLKAFRNHKEELNSLHKKTEDIILPFYPSLFLHVGLLFEENAIQEIDIEITPKPKEGIFRHRECWLGSTHNSAEEREMPWGEYVHPTVLAKGINIKGDYNFALTCTPYQGSKFTNVMFLVYFYILKLHAEFLGIDDYVIAADDQAKVGDKFVMHYAIEKVKRENMTLEQIMRTPLLYYERFGFYYPEKKEFFSNLLNTGEAYIDFYLSDGSKDEDKDMWLTRYYLELKTLPVEKIYNMMDTLTVKVPH